MTDTQTQTALNEASQHKHTEATQVNECKCTTAENTSKIPLTSPYLIVWINETQNSTWGPKRIINEIATLLCYKWNSPDWYKRPQTAKHTSILHSMVIHAAKKIKKKILRNVGFTRYYKKILSIPTKFTALATEHVPTKRKKHQSQPIPISRYHVLSHNTKCHDATTFIYLFTTQTTRPSFTTKVITHSNNTSGWWVCHNYYIIHFTGRS